MVKQLAVNFKVTIFYLRVYPNVILETVCIIWILCFQAISCEMECSILNLGDYPYVSY